MPKVKIDAVTILIYRPLGACSEICFISASMSSAFPALQRAVNLTGFGNGNRSWLRDPGYFAHGEWFFCEKHCQSDCQLKCQRKGWKIVKNSDER
jgi:hypothetical protein